MVNEIIKLEDRGGRQTVNARDLWAGLESKQDFSNWILNRLEGFYEGPDFSIELLESTGGRPRKEFFLTLDTAKHLAMLEKNEKGRLIRQYFIEVERKLVQQPSGSDLIALALIEAKRQLDAKDEKIAALAPGAAAADRIANANGLKSLSDVGKINGIGPLKIFAVLSSRKILYRSRKNWVPYQQYIDAGYFIVRESTYDPGDGIDHLFSKTYVTGKGEVWLAKHLFGGAA